MNQTTPGNRELAGLKILVVLSLIKSWIWCLASVHVGYYLSLHFVTWKLARKKRRGTDAAEAFHWEFGIVVLQLACEFKPLLMDFPEDVTILGPVGTSQWSSQVLWWIHSMSRTYAHGRRHLKTGVKRISAKLLGFDSFREKRLGRLRRRVGTMLVILMIWRHDS